MTKEGNGQSITYHVIMSALTKASVLLLHKQAADLGNGQQFLDAFRKITSRLRNDPLDFGEKLYHLPALRLQVFLAASHGLAVDYAVHAERRLVFIRGFKFLPEHLGNP
jgi:hypothetical protein